MIVILLGVTASGKTTVGRALAQRMEWVFADGDDYHTTANRQKMHAGIALTDEDRLPWLEQLNALLEDWDENGINGILACSALKQQYRDLLVTEIPPADYYHVFLDAPMELIEQRAAARQHAFATPALVASQFQLLEPPTGALRVDLLDEDELEKSVREVVDEILSRLGLKAAQDWSYGD